MNKIVDGQIPQEDLAGYVSDIRNSGYTIVKKFMSNETRNTLKVLVDDFSSEKVVLNNVSSGQALDRYVYHLQYKDVRFIQLFGSSNILEILQPFLNDPFYTQIPKGNPNFTLAYYNARSSVAPLELHIDSYVPSVGNFTTSMQISFSLEGQTKANGATIVVPGSHLLNKYPDRPRKCQNEIVLECDPGDAIIWDSRLWHGALANESGTSRWSLVATFRPWWAKQNFDPVSGLPENVYSQLSPVEKGLLGFLSLPPKNEMEKVALKEGYTDLLDSVKQYKFRRDS